MENMAQVGTSDVFYILASVLVIVLGIGIGVVALYATRILKNVFQISETVKGESRRVVHDVDELRHSIKRNFSMSTLFGLVRLLSGKKKRKQK